MESENELNTIEKVILLQEVDIFEFTSSEDLSKIAAIAREIEANPSKPVYREGDLSDSMFVIVEGAINFTRKGEIITRLENKKSFGTWSLFDDEIRVVTAEPAEKTRLLQIKKFDFFELLAENSQLTEGILKKLTRRIRGLMGQFQTAPGETS